MKGKAWKKLAAFLLAAILIYLLGTALSIVFYSEKDIGMTAYSSPTPTSLYRSLKTKLPFLLREEFFYIGYRLTRLLK